MNQTEIWKTVDPTLAEVQAALCAFAGADNPGEVFAFLPQMVMVRRAVAASFFSEGVEES
jgi:hypothetical protein